MRKDKLKTNFQRIGVFLFACLFVLFSVFPSYSALAATYTYPESLQPWLNLQQSSFTSSPFSTFSLKVADTYNLWGYVLVDDEFQAVDSVRYSVLAGIPRYVFTYVGVTVSTQLYYPLVSELDIGRTHPEILDSVRYLYSLNYEFRPSIDQEFSAVVAYSSLSGDIVGGVLSSVFQNGQIEISLTDPDSNSFVVYSNGLWVDDFYRSPGLIAPMTRGSFAALNNSRFTPSFLDRVSSGLTAVIGWVGAVASAVISGPLSPLLGLVAVGIAVSAILLVIYLVRRFIWGA